YLKSIGESEQISQDIAHKYAEAIVITGEHRHLDTVSSFPLFESMLLSYLKKSYSPTKSH
ncbi:hypothetical protein C6P42_004177, partial [Pichia californica]